MARTKMAVIRDYFGIRSGESLKDFAQELKALTADDKLELAQGAAHELGYTEAGVDFPLT